MIFLMPLNLCRTIKHQVLMDTSAEFYKHFWSILSPLFIRMIIESKQKSKLPDNMNTATISLLLKPNKDPTLPSSYRPISLINVDIKIIAKALAYRLEKVTPSIIHPDQTGFIKGRLASNNTRRLFNLKVLYVGF